MYLITIYSTTSLGARLSWLTWLGRTFRLFLRRSSSYACRSAMHNNKTSHPRVHEPYHQMEGHACLNRGGQQRALKLQPHCLWLAGVVGSTMLHERRTQVSDCHVERQRHELSSASMWQSRPPKRQSPDSMFQSDRCTCIKAFCYKTSHHCLLFALARRLESHAKRNKL